MPLFRSRVSVVTAVLFVAVLVIAVVIASLRSRKSGASARRMMDVDPTGTSLTQQRITHFCGACHAVPLPETFPVQAWDEEVRKGYDFYAESGRNDLVVPPQRDVVAWYKARAPVGLDVAVPDAANDAAGIEFGQVSLPFSSGEPFSAVSHISRSNRNGTYGTDLLFCDMNTGHVASVLPVASAGQLQSEILGRLSNPAHVEPTDLNGDGRTDFVVAELGSLMPADHRDGKVIWLHQPAEESPFVAVVLQDGLGRVADVQPGDFDEDGDLDLVVADFGWRKTGRIVLLENLGPSAESPDVPVFELRVLDERHGTIHVPTADLNGDGHLDFVALVSQEHECVEAFLNNGDATFQRERIFAAPDPSYGSSGIQLVDLDNDGDLDVIYTNGDTVDSFYLKPYHAIHWLENQGAYPFRQHELTRMPGVYRAVAGDLDADGDTDIVACAYIPPPSRLANPPAQKLDTLIWLEQTAPGQFDRHSLSTDYGYVAMEVTDFDHDGDADLAVGNYFRPANEPWLTVWRNLSRQAPAGE